MITIDNTQFTSNISLADMLVCMTNVQMMDICKIRKTPYKLQKYGLVLTYEDYKNGQWHILMPDVVRNRLADSYPPYLDAAMKGVKLPSPKELSIMSAFRRFIGEEE